ncbi:MAG: hypothetical protein E7253_00920 [Lachnospiraceae bacterium]|nr:hypothetical protein [Lachnospiraceae bacterium]
MHNHFLFTYTPNDRYVVDQRYGRPINNEECLIMNETQEEIVLLVGARKYLTMEQIQEAERRKGREISEPELNRILFGLEKRKVLTRYKMIIPARAEEFIFYGLNYWGAKKAKKHFGTKFHKGIRWYSRNERKSHKIPEDLSSDVKRILMGNQILLEMEKAGVPMNRYGVMETFRSLEQEKPALVRSTVNVEVDETSILAFDVVRTYSTSYLEAVSKMERYYQLLKDKNYLIKNYHNHKEFPQIVFVVENEEHAKMLKKYMQERGVWNLEDVTVLFTEDNLVMNHVVKSIYELDANNEKIWYELPVFEMSQKK